MIYLIHGDNLSESRKARFSKLASLKSSGHEVLELDGYKISLGELETALLTGNLFSSRALAIDNLLSRPPSKLKEALVAFVASNASRGEVVLWEKKEVSKSLSSKLGAKISLHKTPPTVFKFLEALAPGKSENALKLYYKTLERAEAGFIFAMLIRHVSSLIIAKTDQQELSGSPWHKSQLVKQSALWTTNGLIDLHSQLLNIDESLKTGATKLDLKAQLDLLLLAL